MADFKIGDVVVCINASNLHPLDAPGSIVRGRHYRVHGFAHDDGIFPDGIRNWCGEGFRAHRFKKLAKASDEFTGQLRALRPLRVEETNS